MYDPSIWSYVNAWVAADRPGLYNKNNTNSPWLIHIETDDRDAFYGWGPGPEYGYSGAAVHLGWVALNTSPKQWWMGGNYNILYSDPVIYTKRGLRDYLKSLPMYQTGGVADISKLNTAWGADYTTWDSSGTNHIESICPGQWDGTKTSCTLTLTNIKVGKNSVGIKVNGQGWAGDHIHWNDSSYGDFAGINGATGTIVYATGTMTVSFTTPPPSGSTVAVDYDSGGYGFGTGLMDENGRHSWVNCEYRGLTNCNSNLKADLDNFLYQFAKQYTSNMAGILHTAYPGILIGGMGTLSNPDGGKTRDAFIKATAEDFDLVFASVGCPTLVVDITCQAYAQRMLNDTYAAMGNSKRPMLPQRELMSDLDSPYFATNCPSANYACAAVRHQRDGTATYDWMKWILKSRDTVSGGKFSDRRIPSLVLHG